MQTTATPERDTKDAILDAAERVFASRGFEGASMRKITDLAGTNLSAVNYHFRSKNRLVAEVIKRMFEPVNDYRLRLLDRLDALAHGKPHSVEAILEALFRPPLELVSEPSENGGYFPRLLAFCLTEPGSYLKPLIEEEFAVKTRRFEEELQRVCPKLTRAEVRWRLQFSTGAFIYTAGNPQLLEVTSEGLCKPDDTETVLKRIVGFCAAGFRVEPI